MGVTAVPIHAHQGARCRALGISPSRCLPPALRGDPLLRCSAMERCLERLHSELAAIRSGRASSEMLEHVRAEVYGERMPLAAVATVLVRDPQLLVVSVFDPSVRIMFLY